MKTEERIKELKSEIAYEKRRNKVCGTSKSDLYYLDSLEEELEKLENIERDGIACPLCEEELECVPYRSKNGKIVYIYTHDTSCPFIRF